MTSSSFTAGAPLPDDVARAIGTCVAAMTRLRILEMFDLSLPVMKTLADRTQPLEHLYVYPPGVNWVSVSVFCQCAHNLLVNAKHCGASLRKRHSFLFNLRTPVRNRCRWACLSSACSAASLSNCLVHKRKYNTCRANDNRLWNAFLHANCHTYIYIYIYVRFA